jgi:hypothetical protein
MADSRPKGSAAVHDHSDLAAIHAAMSPRERLEAAFTLSRVGDRLAKAGKEARSRGK